MAVRFVNNFRAPLASSVSSDATTLSFPAGYGDLFRTALGSALGSDHIYGTLFNSGGDIEIVKITATVDDDFTVVRGVDGTTAKAWLAGDYMACRPCAASLSEAVTLPTNLARSGVNLDITEMRGLTTPLSVDQGGTGVDTYAELLAALGISFPLPASLGGTGVTSLSALKTAMGLVPGTNVLAYVAPGTAGNVLTSNGSAWVSSAPTSVLTAATAQATTSGSTVDFTSIPSWVKRITVCFKGVTETSLGVTYVRIGDAGGVETSGYDGASSSYFQIGENGISGSLVLTKEDGNTWVASGSVYTYDSDTATTHSIAVAGYKTLSDTLTTVRVGTTTTFSAGEVNILYE